MYFRIKHSKSCIKIMLSCAQNLIGLSIYTVISLYNTSREMKKTILSVLLKVYWYTGRIVRGGAIKF